MSPRGRICRTTGHKRSGWARVGAVGAIGVATAGFVAVTVAPTDAQPAATAAVVVSRDAAGIALSGVNSAPSTSDDGTVVAFVRAIPPGDPADPADPVRFEVVVRATADGDQLPVVTVFPVGTAPTAPVVSGNGCRIVYAAVVPDPDPAPDPDAAEDVQPDAEGAPVAEPRIVELRLVDRCPVTAPGDGVGDPAVADPVEPAQAAAPVEFVLDRLAVDTVRAGVPTSSRDGSVVVWSTGAALRRYTVTTLAEPPVVELIGTGSPTDVFGPRADVSADGSVVVFEAGPLDAQVAIPFTPTVASVWTWTAPVPGDPAADPPTADVPARVGRLAPSDAGSSWPTISGDGLTVVYESSAPALIDGAPDDTSYLVVADRSTEPATQRVLTTQARRPTISADGATVVYDAAGGVRVRRSDSGRFETSTEGLASAAAVGLAESVGESVSGPVVAGDGSAVVFDATAGAALSGDAALDAGAHVWTRPTGPLFESAPTTTAVVPTTAATTTVAGTTPAVTVRPTTPRPTTPRPTTPRPTTPRPTTPRPTTTSTVPVLPGFEPSAVDFPSTIAGAGRSTVVLMLSNRGDSSVVVEAVGTEPTAPFVVVANTCIGTLSAGASCDVEVEFAPDAASSASATLVASLSDGRRVAASLTGVGAPPPTLDIVPGVASNGQVVTAFGSGFPAGIEAVVDWNDGQVLGTVVTDDLGGFALPFIVLPNTRSGPTELVVVGQDGRFADVTVTVLVTDSAGRSGAALLGRIGVRPS